MNLHYTTLKQTRSSMGNQNIFAIQEEVWDCAEILPKILSLEVTETLKDFDLLDDQTCSTETRAKY